MKIPFDPPKLPMALSRKKEGALVPFREPEIIPM